MNRFIITLFAGACLLPSLGFSATPVNLPPNVKTLHVNGYDMAYVERGSGPTLVLVHGSLSDYRTWGPLMAELSAENRVVAVSLRHYYPERWEGKGDELSLTEHVKDVSSFIAALKVGPVHLLGHSRGAGVALLAASQHPEQIRSLILADVYPFNSLLENNANAKIEMEKRTALSRTVLAHYKKHDPEGGLVTFVNYITGPNGWDNTSDEQRERLRANTWTQLSLISDAETPVKCPQIANIKAPLLVITGDRSPALYGYANDAVKACLQRGDKATISDAGHMMFQANPSAFATEVQFFVADH